MPLVKYQLPQGMYKNGTPYTGQGRWVDGNLVRWQEGAARPLGGWQRLTGEAGTGIVDAPWSEVALQYQTNIVHPVPSDPVTNQAIPGGVMTFSNGGNFTNGVYDFTASKLAQQTDKDAFDFGDNDWTMEFIAITYDNLIAVDSSTEQTMTDSSRILISHDYNPGAQEYGFYIAAHIGGITFAMGIDGGTDFKNYRTFIDGPANNVPCNIIIQRKGSEIMFYKNSIYLEAFTFTEGAFFPSNSQLMWSRRNISSTFLKGSYTLTGARLTDGTARYPAEDTTQIPMPWPIEQGEVSPGAPGGPIPPLYLDPTVEAPRGFIKWRLNNGEIMRVVGTNVGLYAIDRTNVVTNITPDGFVPQPKDGGVTENGYGTGRYGREVYGTPRQDLPTPAEYLFTWSFALWGEDLIAAARGAGQLIYTWAPLTAKALPLTNAPTSSQGVIVTNQRILITMGGVSDPALVQWSDSEDNTDWASAITNQAGSQTMATKGQFVVGAKVGRDVLLIAEHTTVIQRYIGPPYIFNFENLSENTSIVSANALAVISSAAVWWGYGTFWMYDGGQVTHLDSEVMDFLIEDVNTLFYSKITSFVNSEFDEIWWFYPSKVSSTLECDSYVVFNHADKFWFTGRMDRCYGVDSTAYTRVDMISPDGILYQHELSQVVPDGVNFLESGPIEIGQGDQIAYIDYIYPDTPVGRAPQSKTIDSGATMTLIGKDFPNSVPREYGPFPMGQPSPTRARGRSIALRVTGGPTQIWEHGSARLNFIPGGVR
jgi:hypothetical protein